jgi:2'-5' RNA ligase
MSARLTATDAESLERVVGHVHDAWFDLDQIARQGDVVTIPIALRSLRVKKRFLPSYGKPPGAYESTLIIRRVRSYKVNEPAQIGIYGINEMSFAPPRLTITAEPDCTLTFDVATLDVGAELRMVEYEWASPGATALVVPLPGTDAVIGRLREAHTPSGREGMHAHNTLIAPFHHGSRLDGFDKHAIRDALSPFEPFDVTLASFGLFEHIGCLWLDPEPRDPFVAMTEALLAVYPEIDYPPEGLQIVPHVTIGGHLSAEEQGRIKGEIEPHLPIGDRAERVVLFERGEDGRWFDRETFALS